MIDILDRLRRPCPAEVLCDYRTPEQKRAAIDWVLAIKGDAADEIEQLRKRLDCLLARRANDA